MRAALLIVAFALVLGAATSWNSGFFELKPLRPVNLEDGAYWFGKEENRHLRDDISIREFEFKVSDESLADLRMRLELGLSRYESSSELHGVGWSYGADKEAILALARSWLRGISASEAVDGAVEFNWRKQERILASLPQFLTRIDGLDLHFVHVRARPTGSQRVDTLLMLHGWPGSFYEFHKIAQMLAEDAEADTVFNVVVPSIPGYTFSEAPSTSGVSPVEVGAMFIKLMRRLQYDSYVIQGGDWGAVIANAIALMDTERCRGMHSNFNIAVPSPMSILTRVFPSALLPNWLLSKHDQDKVLPLSRMAGKLFEETGYMHVQGTRPDTLGVALGDSPLGLAVWIIEKFHAWTDNEGDITLAVPEEDLLTNIMLYWSTNCIASSLRLYYEARSPINAAALRAPVLVPTAILDLPKEVLRQPKLWISQKYPNLVQYTDGPRGGHFAALEEPDLLVEDVRNFVRRLSATASKL